MEVGDDLCVCGPWTLRGEGDARTHNNTYPRCVTTCVSAMTLSCSSKLICARKHTRAPTQREGEVERDVWSTLGLDEGRERERCLVFNRS